MQTKLIAATILAIFLVLPVRSQAADDGVAILAYVIPLVAQSIKGDGTCFGVDLGRPAPESSGTAVMPDGAAAFRLEKDATVFFRADDDGNVVSVSKAVRHAGHAEQVKFVADLTTDTAKVGQRNIRPSLPVGGNLTSMKTPTHDVYILPQAFPDDEGTMHFHTWITCLDRQS